MPDTSPVERISVSVKDAAAMTGLSKWTIYKLLSDGAVMSVYEGSRRLVLTESLRDYIANLPTERPETA